MSDAKEAPAKKKKSKLPVIVVAVVVLAAGGYFAMPKPKKKAPKADPEIILGAPVSLGDFVTPLSDGQTYVDVDMQVVLDEKAHLGPEAAGGEEGGKGKEAPDPVSRNAVLTVLRSTSPKAIATPEGVQELKEHIAWQINHDIAAMKQFSKKKEGEEEEAKPEKKKSKKSDDDGTEGFVHIDAKDRDYPALDSDKGPVHLVLFNKFLPINYGSQG